MLRILIENKGQLPFKVIAVTVEKAMVTDEQMDFIEFQRTRDEKKGYSTDNFYGDVVYVLKIHLDQAMPTTSSSFLLYVGEHILNKYSGFDGGIYTIIQNPRFFEKYQHKEIVFKFDGLSNKSYPTGMLIPEVKNLRITVPGEELLSIEEILENNSGREKGLSM